MEEQKSFSLSNHKFESRCKNEGAYDGGEGNSDRKQTEVEEHLPLINNMGISGPFLETDEKMQGKCKERMMMLDCPRRKFWCLWLESYRRKSLTFGVRGGA